MFSTASLGFDATLLHNSNKTSPSLNNVQQQPILSSSTTSALYSSKHIPIVIQRQPASRLCDPITKSCKPGVRYQQQNHHHHLPNPSAFLTQKGGQPSCGVSHCSDKLPKYHISTLLTAYGKSIRINTNGFDFALTLFSLTYFRRRVFEIKSLLGTFRRRVIRLGTHLHVKVTQEITVNLPDGWVPRRHRKTAVDPTQ